MNHAVCTGDAGVITQQQLDGYVGKAIDAICPNGYGSRSENHSAHFVAHVLGYAFGVTCQMMGNGRGPAATLRVRELFSRCKAVGVWRLRPATLQPCLVFMSRASNVNLAAKSMANAPRKHVGIYAGGFVWHYSNEQQKVVKQIASQFALHYRSPDNAMFYGSLL
jgi:hypothetical protein